MDLKRIITALIGLPLVILLMVFGNSQVISFTIMLVALICMNEYFKVIEKICKPIKWVGYLSTIIIFLISVLPINIIESLIIFGSPVILLTLFLHIILTDMKFTFKDIAYTLLGITYITGYIMFLGLITVSQYGKTFLAYTFLVAWSTDVFAYIGGKYIGKHHFSKISPKKTIEGCVTGAVAATIVGVIFSIILSVNNVFTISGLSYLYIGVLTLILSLISQIGDFAASSIKRFADIKDYGNLLPGHGGMLDRIDSLIFIAPFVYMLMKFVFAI